MSGVDAGHVRDFLLALAALLGIGAGSVGLFVLRHEHAAVVQDLRDRIARLEQRAIDRNGAD